MAAGGEVTDEHRGQRVSHGIFHAGHAARRQVGKSGQPDGACFEILLEAFDRFAGRGCEAPEVDPTLGVDGRDERFSAIPSSSHGGIEELCALVSMWASS